MRKFNPEKELRKIQKGNRNKIILFVFLLLVVGVMGYSFALYQVRYSKRIIFTKVAPFNNNDIELAVKIEGEEKTRNTFPLREEELIYSGIECNTPDITTATWNYEKWALVLESTGPNKCTVFFKSGTNLKSYLTKLSDKELITDETQDTNKRFIGANPNNYIWFNCDNYNLVTDNETAVEQHCEKWRIIGIMNNVTKVDEEKNEITNQSLVKIIRNDSIGNIAWNSAGVNNWANASLQKGLNNLYLNNNDDGTWITNGSYGTTNTRSDNYKSITTATQAIIENVRWNIGGTSKWNNAKTDEFYAAERGTEVPSGALPTWDGKIGLMYPSDFGYSTIGASEPYTRAWCLDNTLYIWDTGNFLTYCSPNAWIKPKSDEPRAWTMIPYSLNTKLVFGINYYGTVHSFNNWSGENGCTVARAIYPTLYLKQNINIQISENSKGSVDFPYILIPPSI